MSSVTLKDLYLPSNELPAFFRDHSDAVIDKFKLWCSQKPKNTPECMHGQKNVLMEAVWEGNVHLVSYIVKNVDPKVLNLRDEHGRVALGFYVKLAELPSKEKVVDCAQILIDAVPI